MPHNAPTVYRMYDDEDRLLYVGVTRNLPARTSSHRSSLWAPLARARSVEHFPTWGLALNAEHYAIEQEGPLYNDDRSDCFQGNALDARAAIPSHLERQPLNWRNVKPFPNGVPYPRRLAYTEWGWAVIELPADRAAELADGLRLSHPELADVLRAEHVGVPGPWGEHAVVAYALRFKLMDLDAIA